MKHLDDEQLSLLALGEPAVSPAEADHLAFCSECSGTLAALERTVRAATVDPAEVELATPGPHNWAAIHQALGLSPEQAQDPLSRDPSPESPTAGRTTAGRPAAAPVTSAPPTSAPPTSAPVTAPTPLRPRAAGARAGSGARRWVAMAAAAGIVVGAAAVWAGYSVLGRGPEAVPSPTPTAPRPVVIAQAPLQPLASYTANGKALVEELPDGTRQLVVQLPDSRINGFREVWVISPDLSKLVSLGVLDGEPGVFAIPEGLDLAEYPIVDVSNEPFDGNPAHSSDSIARGELATEN
ncbi:anti-sigma factor domain-containing protein [Arthrobacter sp. B10-11]|uniref:anti-sigma factor domain-containing protein n=1 Tax=Arthrobacter sp. B10-11 TaxID=3081160 RepID=UPI0029547DBD|nr:anti-sigma factor [Arthrobacter sp. B10-11]MDV8147047.1 anti-sigma factor [Arthrobacter sp. B10-11]